MNDDDLDFLRMVVKESGALMSGIHMDGIDRVVIDYDGYAMPLKRAGEIGIFPIVAFMRDDGWVLGAPAELAAVAFGMWEKEWTHFVVAPMTEYIEIKYFNQFWEKMAEMLEVDKG